MSCQHRRVVVTSPTIFDTGTTSFHAKTTQTAHCADCRAPLPIRFEGDGGDIRVVYARPEVRNGDPYRDDGENRVEVVIGDRKSAP